MSFAWSQQYVKADPATGNLPPDTPPQIAIKAVRLSQANYRTISELIPEDGSIGDIDLVMFKDPSRPIGYGFKAAASRLKALQMQKEAAELARPYLSEAGALARFLGKKVSAARMKAELTDASTGMPEALDDFDVL
jgi:hypothetical protein